MSTETIAPHALAEQYGKLIFHSLFAHDPEGDDRRHSHQRRSNLAPELRIPEVTEADQVEADDILVVIEDDEFGNRLQTFTAYDVIRYAPRTHLVRVVSKTKKSIVATYVDLPGRGNWRINLAEFGTPNKIHEPQRLMLSSLSRQIGRLGTFEELRQKLADHPQFAEWQAAYTAAEREHDAEQAKARAARDAEQQRLAPIKAAVQGLADVTGERLVTMAFSDTPRGENPWLEANDFMRVRVYLAGLNAVGNLTDEQHRWALTHLDVIIAAAKGKQ